jgi:hypothetical protein
MSSTRQRSDRPDSARRRQFPTPETLESRQLLSTTLPAYQSLYVPSDLYVTNPITHQRIPTSIRSLVQHNNPNSPLLSNQGKIVSGTDRQGDQWTLTVHGPGQVIVTDTTPNDGQLDDDINTIQIVGSNPRTTYVTGTVITSNRVLSSGTVLFNRMIALNGVKSIDLNGFDLSHDVNPAVQQQAGIFLYGGVQTLHFHDILGVIDTSGTNLTNPYQIVIGDPTTPLTVKPSIYLDSIYNSVFDSTATTAPTGPLTTPSVLFSVNGAIQNFSLVSITQSAYPPNYVASSQNGTLMEWTGVPQSGPIPSAFQFFFNVVGTTGRTSLQTTAINRLNVVGKATNFTAQRGTVPFTSSLSGMNSIGRARFGGNADAVALDVKGTIGSLTFRKGLGNPSSVFTGKTAVPGTSTSQTPLTQLIPASQYGVPLGSTGYPAAGLQGGVVKAQRIRAIKVGPASYTYLTAQNPNFVQITSDRSPTYVQVNPGTALTNSAITTQGSIDSVSVTGNQLNSEIKTGFDYASYVAGLQATRGASRIARIRQRGDLVNSVDSATFIPAQNSSGQFVYSYSTGTAGPGSIGGTITGVVGRAIYAKSNSRHAFPGTAYNTGGRTALGNYGAGFYARVKSGNLPPRAR